MQVVSQGWVQIRPHIPGRGFRSRTTFSASWNRPAEISDTYDFTFTPAGQAKVHGDGSAMPN